MYRVRNGAIYISALGHAMKLIHFTPIMTMHVVIEYVMPFAVMMMHVVMVQVHKLSENLSDMSIFKSKQLRNRFRYLDAVQTNKILLIISSRWYITDS